MRHAALLVLPLLALAPTAAATQPVVVQAMEILCDGGVNPGGGDCHGTWREILCQVDYVCVPMASPGELVAELTELAARCAARPLEPCDVESL